jgi:hypothetical protein
VDVLGPDHLGVRANLKTVPPDLTLEALGSRQAIDRSRTVVIDAGDGRFSLPVPSLVGAIVIKARVVGNTQGRDSQPKHERDLARLLALVQDPVEMQSALSSKERRYLRARAELLNSNHPAWTNVSNAGDGAIALGVLSEANPAF